MRKLLLITMLLSLHGMARGQTDGFRYLYWFDADQTTLQEGQSATPQWQLSADISGLSEALHTLFVLVSDSEGRYTQPVARTFVKTNDDKGLEGYYWFDKNTATMQQSPVVNGIFDVDASSLSDGFHSIFFQVRQNDGSLTQPVERHFVKVAQTENVEFMTCVCSIDGEKYKEQLLPSNGGIIAWEFDVSSLSIGFHHIQVQAITASGAATSVHEALFLRTNTSEELNQMHCVYSVDDNQSGTEACVASNGTYHFDIDMSQLTDGIHRLSYQLTDGNGMGTAVQTRFFIKNPVGGNGVTKYEYWINDQAEEPYRTVLNPPVNPYSLAALLPIESQPLRSSQFHFELKDGEPYIYAKNSLHVRFYDKAQRFTDVTEDYVDYAVSQAVTDVGELVSGVKETFDMPAENAIKWYSLQAERGDSLRFKLDKASTIQLFAPSNQEVYNVSGIESVGWGGLHVAESGTFYVAIHDVTATQGTTLSLDYEHIDKYAVLRQDVSVVGNKEYSTITFDGNGFDELESVDLIMDQETITSVEVKAQGKSMAAVKFYFEGAALGEYKAVFHFTEGDIVRQNCITVEEATPISYDITAIYNKIFLLSQHKTKYTFKVHNNGNVSAYNVPLRIRVYTQSAESLNRIEIEGFNMKNHIKRLLGVFYTDSLDTYYNIKRAESGDRCFFWEEDSTYIIDGWASHLCETFVLSDLPPNSTKEITVSLDLNDSVYCYMWYLPDERSYDIAVPNGSNGTARSSNRDGAAIGDYPLCVRCAWAKAGGDLINYPLFGVTPGDCKVGGCDCKDNCGDGDGGPSNPGKPIDPNEIYGYEAASGSKAIKDGLTEVGYTIQFENDPTFATAAAHDIWVRTTLDANKFDLSTYRPTKVKIGNKELELNGSPNFSVTLGMQPEINAVAQIDGTFDESTGAVSWHLSSLDPMTVEPTYDVMQGILPVNSDGQGIGEVSFDISLKPDLPHGTEVPNQASIVFDTNEAIMTPVWTNVIDRIAPESHITNVQIVDESTASVSIEATDELSGVWRYDVYVQYGTGSAWVKAAENVASDAAASVKIYEGINHGFYVVATDMAGNVESKEEYREMSLNLATIIVGDANSDGQVDIADVTAIINKINGVESNTFNPDAADVNKDGKIDIGDVTGVINIINQ